MPNAVTFAIRLAFNTWAKKNTNTKAKKKNSTAQNTPNTFADRRIFK